MEDLLIWGLLIFVFLALKLFFVDYLPKQFRRRKYLRSDISKVDGLSGFDFEDYLEALYNRLGYRTIETPKQGDFGVDLILKKNGETICVQAKRYKGSVGIEAVQQIYAGNAFYSGDRPVVVTNSRYTKAAKTLADKIGVELIAREELKRLMNQAKRK